MRVQGEQTLFGDPPASMASQAQPGAAAPIHYHDQDCGHKRTTGDWAVCKRPHAQRFRVRMDGAGNVYCSDTCKRDGYIPTVTTYQCSRCGNTARRNANGRTSDYGCKRCLPARILRLFRVYNMDDFWARIYCETTTCQVPGCDTQFVTLNTQKDDYDLRSPAHRNVDHDHGCCNTHSSCCGQCIRGIICGRCNTVAGMLESERATWVRAYLQH